MPRFPKSSKSQNLGLNERCFDFDHSLLNLNSSLTVSLKTTAMESPHKAATGEDQQTWLNFSMNRPGGKRSRTCSTMDSTLVTQHHVPDQVCVSPLSFFLFVLFPSSTRTVPSSGCTLAQFRGITQVYDLQRYLYCPRVYSSLQPFLLQQLHSSKNQRRCERDA